PHREQCGRTTSSYLETKSHCRATRSPSDSPLKGNDRGTPIAVRPAIHPGIGLHHHLILLQQRKLRSLRPAMSLPEAPSAGSTFFLAACLVSGFVGRRYCIWRET